ncbi:flippase [bacterium]|nr:flippase [candidate division CSSED10-310 bacterium]
MQNRETPGSATRRMVSDGSSGVLLRVAKNSVVVLAAKFIEISSSLITLMLLARILEPARYGDFALLNAIVLAFQPLINLEINTILIREMASARDREHVLLGGGMLLKAILVVIFLASAVCLDRIMAFDPLLRTAFYLAVAAEVFQQVVWVYSTVFMARERMEFEPLLSLISRFISVSGIGLIALFHSRETMGTRGFVLIFLLLAISQALRAILGMIIAAGFLKSYRIQWSLKVAGELFRQSWIMGLATFCTGLSLRIDVFFLKYFGSSEDVALFHVPHMYSLQIQILAVSVVTALFPVLSRWGSNPEDSDRFGLAQDLSIRLMTLFGLLLAILSTLFPQEIIRILAGDRYSDAVPAMLLLSWCIPVLFLNYLGANLLTAIKKQNLLFVGASISLLINGILDYLWIPDYGIIGASAATILAYSVQVSIVFLLLRMYGRNPIHAWMAIDLPVLLSLTIVFGIRFLVRTFDPTESVSVMIRVIGFLVAAIALFVFQPASVRQFFRRMRR